jgi:hypothetical protein
VNRKTKERHKTIELKDGRKKERKKDRQQVNSRTKERHKTSEQKDKQKFYKDVERRRPMLCWKRSAKKR